MTILCNCNVIPKWIAEESISADFETFVQPSILHKHMRSFHTFRDGGGGHVPLPQNKILDFSIRKAKNSNSSNGILMVVPPKNFGSYFVLP